MIIDVHGHYTTAPKQLAGVAATPDRRRWVAVHGTADDHRTTRSARRLATGQLKLQQDRGTDVTLFSPTAGGMAHHYGDEETSQQWTRTVNDLIHRVVRSCSRRTSSASASCRSRRA